jgi:hypothetical protein
MEALLWIILAAPMMMLRGWVIMKLWAWFIIPFGIQGLTLPHAMGVGLILTFLTAHTLGKNAETMEEKIKEIVTPIVWPLLTLLMGYIVQSFM